jgi:hypothetical protein
MISTGGHRSGHDLMVTLDEASRRHRALIKASNAAWALDGNLCKYAPLYVTGALLCLAMELLTLWLASRRSLLDVGVVLGLCLLLSLVVVLCCCTADFYRDRVRRLWGTALPMALLAGLVVGLLASAHTRHYAWLGKHLSLADLADDAQQPLQQTPDPSGFNSYTFHPASFVDTAALQAWATDDAVVCLAPVMRVATPPEAAPQPNAMIASAPTGVPAEPPIAHETDDMARLPLAVPEPEPAPARTAFRRRPRKPARRVRSSPYPSLARMDPAVPAMAYWAVDYNCCAIAPDTTTAATPASANSLAPLQPAAVPPTQPSQTPLSPTSTPAPAAAADAPAVTCRGFTDASLSLLDATRVRAPALPAAIEALHRVRPDLPVPREHVFVRLRPINAVSEMRTADAIAAMLWCTAAPVLWPALAVALHLVLAFMRGCVRPPQRPSEGKRAWAEDDL